jgi:tetratricopeptide (TPR) repeat protein
MRYMKALTTIVSAIALTRVAAAQATDISQWRRDLKVIAEELPATHPDAFYRLKRQAWDSAVAALDTRLPSLSRNQAMVAFSQLVALVKDGHTSINPMFDTVMNVHYYPVQFDLFEDGLFVQSAAPQYASIVGAKVLRIGKVSSDEALAAMATTFGHENEWWANAWAPTRLNLAEFLDGLGLVDDASHLPVVIEKDGKRTTVTLEPTGRIRPSGHNPLAGFDTSGWIDMRNPGSTPLWLSNPGKPYWSQFNASDSTLFISYRAVVSLDNEPNNAFWRGMFAMTDSLPVKRLVIDLRENTGGNSTYNRQVVRGIIARPHLDRQGSLFVIIGDHTFSAAMNLVQDLEQWTNATFVGVPTGNATVFFGDHEQIVLPVSGITVNVSTLPWYPANPRDKRSFIAPRLYAPLTSSDYRGGVDPAMVAIRRFGSAKPIGERVDSLLARGDSNGALDVLAAAARDPVNRFRSPEADINSLGYRLLPTDKPRAIALFRLNTLAFPNSPNVWDSYGEALLNAGQRDAAVASYRKAVALDPAYASAKEALRRLGISL